MTARPDNFATTFNGTGAGTNAGVTVTRTGSTGKRQMVTDLQASGDAAALVTVESPSGTVLFRKRFAAAFNISERLRVPLKGAADADILVKVSASTSNSEANLQGYQVP